MKFITTANDKGEEELFVFPVAVPHDAMAEVLSRIKNQTHGDWRRIHRLPISAGFVTSDLVCHGRSESLGLSARPEDTALLARQLGEH